MENFYQVFVFSAWFMLKYVILKYNPQAFL